MELSLYIATGNPGKLRDFEPGRSQRRRCALASLAWACGDSRPAGGCFTFEENAAAKAIAYSRYAPGQIVLADDSGLEVDALGGAPGVRSARFAADAGFNPELLRTLPADECNNLLLMEKLRGIPQNMRGGRYRCVLAAVRDGECIHLAHGTVEGIILEAPRGTGGFGYDPLFYLPELGRTMAEISLEEKNQLSHRGHAMRALLRQLRA